jgi:hypothetical protein
VTISTRNPFRNALRVVDISTRHDEPSLAQAILNVLAIGPDKEMGRVAARRIIACVASQPIPRVDTSGEKQGESGRGIPLRMVLNAAIPTWNSISSPRPTGVRSTSTVNAIPEVVNLIAGKVRHGYGLLHKTLRSRSAWSGGNPRFYGELYHFGG